MSQQILQLPGIHSSQDSQKPTFPWEITITSFLCRSYRERSKRQSHPKKIKGKSPRPRTKIKGNLRGEGKLLKTGVGGSVGWFSAWFLESCFYPFQACRSRSTQGVFFPSGSPGVCRGAASEFICSTHCPYKTTKELIQGIPPPPLGH